MSDPKKSQPKVPARASRPLEAAEEGHALATTSSPADRLLVERLLAGDEATFTALVEQHHGALLRLARVFVSSQGVAEEVVQETWIGVLRGLHKFEGRSSLKTWIFRILTNRAKTRGVREARSVPFSSLGNPDSEHSPVEHSPASYNPAVSPERFEAGGMWANPPRPWQSDTPEKKTLLKQAIEQLASALEELPPNQRAVVTLRDIEGLEPREVCSVLEISEANQRVLLHRGRSKLRAVLEDYMDGA